MGGLQLSTPEQQDAMQEMLRSEVKPPKTQARNVALAAQVNATAVLEFRHRRYRVPPVPYIPGLLLNAAWLELARLSELEEEAIRKSDVETLRDVYGRMQQVMKDLTPLFREFSRPVGLGQRLFWRWLSNPFMNCSMSEFGQLLNFFCECRTRSSVRVLVDSVSQPSLSSETKRMS